MSILIEPDVWLKALAGGAMIGLAAAMILLFNGRIAGVSGIVGGLLTGRIDSDSLWRIAFVAGAGTIFAGLGRRYRWRLAGGLRHAHR